MRKEDIEPSAEIADEMFGTKTHKKDLLHRGFFNHGFQNKRFINSHSPDGGLISVSKSLMEIACTVC